jgi:protein-S-isoprenylcysteine O-methyltransferase Ste14
MVNKPIIYTNKRSRIMKKMTALLYGVLCYAVFFISFLYAIGFVGNMVVPKGIDSGPEASLPEALTINVALLALFAIQHTIMARPAFKTWWTRFIPKEVERSTFVLAASLLLLLLYWQWRPMSGVVWSVENAAGAMVLWSIFWLGWLVVFSSTFMINHFDLFGLRQVMLPLMNTEYTHVAFKTTMFYKFVRHPIMLGFIIAFWATPHMTAGHLLFAGVTTVYILMGLQLEEHDLRAAVPEYGEYSQDVPMLIPGMKIHHHHPPKGHHGVASH